LSEEGLTARRGQASVTMTLDRYGHLMPGERRRGGAPAGQAPHSGMSGYQRL